MQEIKTSELLQAARSKLEGHWCQNTAARNKHGEPCAIACGVNFCAFGALVVATLDGEPGSQLKDNAVSQALTYLNTVVRDVGGVPLVPDNGSGASQIIYYNDTPGRTEAEVLAMLDKAIERAKKEEETHDAST